MGKSSGVVRATLGGMVFVVVGCVEFATSMVMAAFATQAEADAYVAEYQAHEFPKDGPGYKAWFEWYEVVPVEVGARPFDYDDLAKNRAEAGAR